MSIEDNNSIGFFPRTSDLSSHRFLATCTVLDMGYFSWSGLSQTVTDYSHSMPLLHQWARLVTPVVIVCRVRI